TASLQTELQKTSRWSNELQYKLKALIPFQEGISKDSIDQCKEKINADLKKWTGTMDFSSMTENELVEFETKISQSQQKVGKFLYGKMSRGSTKSEEAFGNSTPSHTSKQLMNAIEQSIVTLA